MWRRFGCVALGGYATACGVGLSSNQPAHVPSKGHAHAELGVDVSYPTGTIPDVIRAAESVEQATDARVVSDDEKRKIFEGAAAIAINPPAAVPHTGFDYGVAEGWEVGARLATSGLRLAARHQLLTQADDGVDFSLGLGIGRALFTPPVHSVFDSVTVDDFRCFSSASSAALRPTGRCFWKPISRAGSPPKISATPR